MNSPSSNDYVKIILMYKKGSSYFMLVTKTDDLKNVTLTGCSKDGKTVEQCIHQVYKNEYGFIDDRKWLILQNNHVNGTRTPNGIIAIKFIDINMVKTCINEYSKLQEIPIGKIDYIPLNASKFLKFIFSAFAGHKSNILKIEEDFGKK